MAMEVIIALEVNGFNVLANVQDGASTNRSFYMTFGIIRASQFFSEEEMGNFEHVDFDYHVAMRHPLFGRSRPIFLLDDPPHWLKKMRNLLYESNHRNFDLRQLPKGGSSRVTAPRHMKIPRLGREKGAPFFTNFFPLNLRMIQRGVGLVEGILPTVGVMDVQTVRGLDMSVFSLTPASKMNVFRATVPFKEEVRNILKLNKGEITYQSPDMPSFDYYGGLLEYCEHVGKLWDFFNSNRISEFNYHSVSDPHDEKLMSLLDHLQWFGRWRHDLQDEVLDLDDDERQKSFLSPETWAETQGLILGFNCLARQYLGNRLDKLIPRRFNQDPAERHFSHIRCFTRGQGTTVSSIVVAGSAACAVTLSKFDMLGKNAKRNVEVDASKSSRKRKGQIDNKDNRINTARAMSALDRPLNKDQAKRARREDRSDLKDYTDKLLAKWKRDM